MIKRMFKEAKMMKSRLVSHLRSIFGASVLIFATLVVSLQLAQAQTSGNCGMQLGGTAIFCEPFDVVNSGIPSRTGALDPNVWGVSRTTGNVNWGQGQSSTWAPTALLTCTGTATVTDPNDVQICNGQLREASNDNPSGVFDGGSVTALAMYPKQPFDFAGRKGTVSFDVSNDSQGVHAAWPEFWMSDLPVPAPLEFNASWVSLPQNGFGVRFSAVAQAGVGGLCPNSNNLSANRWTVNNAIVVRNYVYEDADYQGFESGTASNPLLTLNILDCVISPAEGSGIMNHVEIQVTPNEIDVYATDAGVVPSPTTLRKIASITNANLTFTRGLVWLEDVHYNADKQTLTLGTAPSTSQSQHTFFWDNLAFDGPFPGRDFTYDALDALTPFTGDNFIAGSVNLGQFSDANQTTSWNVPNVPANPQASAVRVLFNFYNAPSTNVVNVTVNGNTTISTPWPYPDMVPYTGRTFAVTIPITDLVAGTNVVQIGTDQPTVTSNVNILLAGVPGAVPVLPGNSRSYPGGGSRRTASHDFNGDGKSDIAWRDAGGDTTLWLMSGAAVSSAGDFGANPSTWAIVGERDFNGDGMADLLWRDTSGNTAIWFMNGTQQPQAVYLSAVGTDWAVAGTGDFNGDGKGDILWRHNDGNIAIWLMNGAQILQGVVVGGAPTSWTIVGTGDFNGDGTTDILWRNSDGTMAIWLLNAGQFLQGIWLGAVPTSWTVAGTGDFNGDGATDILWRDNAGNIVMWLMSGGQLLQSVAVGNLPTAWSIAETGDYNGDGMSDLLWRDTSGNTAMWFMNGATISSTALIGNVPPNWTVQSVNAE
jgi:FG-GAP-like repeat